MGSTVTGLLGVAGGAGGTGFAGPAQSNITNPVTQDQINAANTATQGGLSSQQAFLNAVQAQNGLQNQSNVYNQLQGVANGTGPNPAQAMLNQATGANVANQAALMAGQRGASQNAGLIARQAAMQGASTQQQAAGQGATMQANQSLNAMGQMGSMANTQAGQQAAATSANTQALQAQQQALINAQLGYNQNQTQSTGSVNAANAGMVSARMGSQGAMMGGLMQGAGTAMGLMAAQGGKVQKYAGGTADVQAPAASFTNAPPVPPAAQAAPAQQPGGPSKFANFVNYKQQNGNNAPPPSNDPNAQLFQGASKLGQGLGNVISSGWHNLFGPSQSAGPVGPDYNQNSDWNQQMMDVNRPDLMEGVQMPASNTPDTIPTTDDIAVGAKGGKVPALLSPGEKYLSPKAVKEVEKTGKNPMQVGKTIPGKPKVGGAKNDYANDIVPAKLETGGVVLPRSVTQAPDAPQRAAEFVAKLQAKKPSLPARNKK